MADETRRGPVRSARERARDGELEKPSMSAVLDFYGIDFPRNRGGWISILCPLVAEDNPSCRVNLDEGAFMCHSCGGSGGDTLALIMLRDGLSFPEAKALALTIPGERSGSTSTKGRRAVTARSSGYAPRYRKRAS